MSTSSSHAFLPRTGATKIGVNLTEVSFDDSPDEGTFEFKNLDRTYTLSKSLAKKYPKLLDDDASNLMMFEDILPLLCYEAPDLLDEKIFEEKRRKQLFLANCEFLCVKLTPQTILHLSKHLKKELKEMQAHISCVAGSKGKRKMRFSLKKEVVAWCLAKNDEMKALHKEMSVLEIIQKLETGEDSFLDSLIVEDFETNNLISHIVGECLKKFLGRV